MFIIPGSQEIAKLFPKKKLNLVEWKKRHRNLSTLSHSQNIRIFHKRKTLEGPERKKYPWKQHGAQLLRSLRSIALPTAAKSQTQPKPSLDPSFANDEELRITVLIALRVHYPRPFWLRVDLRPRRYNDLNKKEKSPPA